MKVLGNYLETMVLRLRLQTEIANTWYILKKNMLCKWSAQSCGYPASVEVDCGRLTVNFVTWLVKVNNLSRWSTVFMRMKLHTLLPISAATKQIKDIYQK